METMKEKFQELLDQQYTKEEQEEFEWYTDSEDNEKYVWRFVDHTGKERKLVFYKDSENVTFY